MSAFPRPGATPEDNASEVAAWIKAFAEARPPAPVSEPPVVKHAGAGNGAGKNAAVKRKKPAPKKAGPKKGRR